MTPREDDDAPQRDNNHRDSVDMSYGGVSLAAKGSIVVLVILLVGGTAVNFWLAHQIEQHLRAQDTLMQSSHTELRDELLRAEGIFSAKHDTTVQQIQANRLYLREIERLCIMTNEQRLKMQNSLSSYMKELLELNIQEKGR